jgi:hypothetical protein
MSTRRRFVRRIGAAIGVGGLAGLAGCGATTSGGGSDEPLRVAFQAPAESVDINTWHGVTEYADDTRIETQTFEGVDLAVQSVLAGEADVARGSVTAAATIADAGEPVEFVVSPIRSTDYVLVTRPGIESLADIVEGDAVIGMSAPTGLDAVQTAAVMFEAGVIDDVDELNFQRVGYSSARKTAIQEGEIDVSPQHYAQWLDMREGTELNNLFAFGDRLDRWIQETFMLPPRTLESKGDQVRSFLEGQLRANRALYDDYELYREVVGRHVDGGGPSEAILEPTYEFLTDIEVWPPNGGLARADVSYMLELTNQLGVTDERVSTDEVLNRTPLEAALDEVGRV